MAEKPLGRRQPPNLNHVSAYPLRALIADPAHKLVVPPAGTEKSLGLPWWWKTHDQGVEGSCVGFGSSAMMSVTNHYQRRLATGQDLTYRYAARWLYSQAQLVDEWDDTPPEEGTSVRASCQILQQKGHIRVQRGVEGALNPAHGIDTYRWAESVDDVRAAIYAGLAVSIGVAWYSSFDKPLVTNGERFLTLPSSAWVRGGHCVCIYRMSDRRQAFCFMNSWGDYYPPTWIPYDIFERLLDEWGEAAVIVDR
jgi:hypothetical protein